MLFFSAVPIIQIPLLLVAGIPHQNRKVPENIKAFFYKPW